MAAWISSPTRGVAVGAAGGAEEAHAERRAIQAATPCRSSTTSPEGQPAVEPVSTWVRNASYAVTDVSFPPVIAAALFTDVFFLSSECPLDAVRMHLELETLPSSTRQLR